MAAVMGLAMAGHRSHRNRRMGAAAGRSDYLQEDEQTDCNGAHHHARSEVLAAHAVMLPPGLTEAMAKSSLIHVLTRAPSYCTMFQHTIQGRFMRHHRSTGLRTAR